jgi:hypothetical protein
MYAAVMFKAPFYWVFLPVASFNSLYFNGLFGQEVKTPGWYLYTRKEAAQ